MDDPIVGEIASRLTSRFGARRVLLYGSRARGTARPDSDYDLVVVAEIPGHRHERAVAVRRALRDLDVALDVVVYTPAEWDEHRSSPYSFAHHVDKSAIVLHAA
jgi:predicted nucleotidyltransferase